MIVEYYPDNDGNERPEVDNGDDVPEPVPTDCENILKQNTKTCTYLFTDYCSSCDTRLDKISYGTSNSDSVLKVYVQGVMNFNKNFMN